MPTSSIVGGQALIGDGFHAEGETRLINADVGGDVDCDNGHFLHPDGDALSFDGAVIGRSLRIGADGTSPTDETKDLPTGFLRRGTFRLWGTQVNQDVLANGAQFESPAGTAILACNLKVASRVVLTGVKAKEPSICFRPISNTNSTCEAANSMAGRRYGNIAFWANGMHVRGHVYCNQVDGADRPYRFRVQRPHVVPVCDDQHALGFVRRRTHQPGRRRARRQRLPRRRLRQSRHRENRWPGELLPRQNRRHVDSQQMR